MATLQGPTEGRSGGKRGHSNMEHWVFNGEVKEAARLRRRLGDKAAVEESFDVDGDHGVAGDAGETAGHG